MKKLILLIALSNLLAVSIAQKKSQPTIAQKKSLSTAVYDSWKEIPWKGITPDGNFAAFLVTPQDGDGRAVFYDLRTGGQDSVPRAGNVFLTYDSKHAVFKITPKQSVL